MIRSSLESKLYILPGTRLEHQLARGFVTAPQVAERPRSRLPRWLVMLAGLVVLLLVAFRIWGLSFDWHRFLGTFRQVDWRWLMAGICLTVLGNLTRAARWQVMLRPPGGKASVWRIMADTLIGFTAIALLGRVGEAVRPYLIAVHARLPVSSQVAAWLLERMLDLLAVLLLFGSALLRIQSAAPHLRPQVQRSLGAGGYVLAAAGVLCPGVLVVFRNFPALAQERILSALAFLREHHYRRAEQMLEAFSWGLECTRNSRLLALLVGYTALLWAVTIGHYYALLQSLPAAAHLTVGDVVILLGFMAFGSLINMPGIAGGQVASVVVLTAIYGLPLETAAGTVALFWVAGIAVVVPAGLACAFHEGLNWSKLKLLSTKQILDD